MVSCCSKRNFYFTEKDFQGVAMDRGDEFGHFSFGSTIVLIFEAPKQFRRVDFLKNDIEKKEQFNLVDACYFPKLHLKRFKLVDASYFPPNAVS